MTAEGKENKAVELDNVTIALAGRTILSRISLAIESGEFIGVLGPNGSGKTTLMRAILGLIPPAGGVIRVLGEPARRGNPAVGYMPQHRHTTASLRLSGWDFVASAVNGHRWGLPGARVASTGARTSMGYWIWWARAPWPNARSWRPPAASASACCWPRPSSAGPGCCCWTSRSSASTRIISASVVGLVRELSEGRPRHRRSVQRP